MKTLLRVLSEEERAQIHERTLGILADTGMRVETAQGRQILKEAGAEVDEGTKVVRFPRPLVEEALRVAPGDFTLGARRPGWGLKMNGGDCKMIVDGEAVSVYETETGQHRPGRFEDWLETTRLIDALDEIGAYWCAIEAGQTGETPAEMVNYWRHLFGNFSKHVQDAIMEPELAPWFLEVLQVVFGDRETIRREHPISFLLCPQSPLVIDGTHTDAYLALLGWDVPAAVMPMPLMGATAPGSLISTAILGNCEVLGMLCLIQAAAPGTPFIYAPALAVMNPRSAGYGGGPVEHGLLWAASTEMGRYYGLPVEASGLGTDTHVPGIQTAYERAMNGLLSVLSWPDLLVGPGLLGGSMILCREQLIIDAELFRMARRAFRGISAGDGKWLDDVIARAGPGGHFLYEESTVEGTRDGEWYISKFGVHDTLEEWNAAGRPDLLEEAREKAAQLLASHEPLPLGEDAARELARIEERAREA